MKLVATGWAEASRLAEIISKNEVMIPRTA